MAGLFQGEQRRAMTIAAVGFGLVIVLFVGSRLLSGGGDEAADDVSQPPPTTAPGGPTQPETGGGAAGGAAGEEDEAVPVIPIPELPDTFEIRELRDPFTPPLQQILTERELAGLGDPDAPGEPGEPGEPGAEEPGGPAARVTLRSIQTDDEGDPFAVLDVDGTLFEAAEGETFGPNDEFAVASIDVESECALLLFGDEPFTECVDETIPQK